LCDRRLEFIDAGGAPSAGRKGRRRGHEGKIDFRLRWRRRSARDEVFQPADQFFDLRDRRVAGVGFNKCSQHLDCFLVFAKVGKSLAQDQVGDVAGPFAVIDGKLSLIASFFLFLLPEVNVTEKIMGHPISGVDGHGLFQGFGGRVVLFALQLYPTQQRQRLHVVGIESGGAAQVVFRLIHFFVLHGKIA